jgi:hypothetical protein
VSSELDAKAHDEDDSRSFDDEEFAGMGEEVAERRRRMEEERRGRMCPICLGKPVAGRMTKCGHVSNGSWISIDAGLTADLLLSLYTALHPAVRHPQVGQVPHLRRYRPRGHAQVGEIPRCGDNARG